MGLGKAIVTATMTRVVNAVWARLRRLGPVRTERRMGLHRSAVMTIRRAGKVVLGDHLRCGGTVGVVYDITHSRLTDGHLVIAAGWDGRVWAIVIPPDELIEIVGKVDR